MTTSEETTKLSETAKWTAEHRLFLYEKLQIQKRGKGNMTDNGGFKTETWTRVINLFNKTYGVNWPHRSFTNEWTATKARLEYLKS